MQLDDLFLKACQNGQKSVVITFLKKGGINVDKRDMNGLHPYITHARKGRELLSSFCLKIMRM